MLERGTRSGVPTSLDTTQGASSNIVSNATYELEMAVWAVADGRATEAEIELVDRDPGASRRMVATLASRVRQDLEAVRMRTGIERDLAVADLEE